MTGLETALRQATDAQDGSEDRPNEAFLICDDELRVVHASKGLEQLLRLPDPIGDHMELNRLLSLSMALDLRTRTAIADRLEEALSGQREWALDLLSSPDEPTPVAVHIQRVGDTHWILSFEDMHAKRVAEDRVASLILTDALTGLGNRVRFRQSLIQALSERPPVVRRIALIAIDLDRFKAVNDTLGHPVGDELLSKVGVRLRSVIRHSDMLARLGGDEFAAWMPVTTDRDAVERIAKRIIDLLSRPFLIEGLQVNIGASLGIAVAPEDGETYEALMKAADLALYAAKDAGRSAFHFFDNAMEERAQERRRLEIDLRRAPALQQFELYYRPQIDVESGELLALEALLRWRHPERGLLEPASFMMIAEDIGLLGQLGHWMINAACRQAASWPERVKLVLGMSAPQFEAGGVVELVTTALAAWGLPAHRLHLEISEAVLLRNEGSVVRVLHELRATGAEIGISQFGTGYASLTRLDSFPFNRIRLDGSLMEMNLASHRAIINAVAAFGATLGVSTTVDGIRSEAQLQEIKAGRATAVQGLFSAEAICAQDLDRMLVDVGTQAAFQTAAVGEGG